MLHLRLTRHCSHLVFSVAQQRSLTAARIPHKPKAQLAASAVNLLPLHPSSRRTMADDASYNTFLAKANADPSATTSSQSTKTQSTSQAKSKFDPSSLPNDSLPTSLQSIACNPSHTYTSDTDSEWEPTFFSYSGSGPPSISDFKKCLAHDSHKQGSIEELSVQDFDPQGQHKAVVDAVRQAGQGGSGEAKVFRVEIGSTRVAYYVLTVAEDGRKLVGVVTNAVES